MNGWMNNLLVESVLLLNNEGAIVGERQFFD
jgi:hypothetical protein